MSNPETYTVGWICAIVAESVAAQEFLDEEDDPPAFVQTHDDNNYTLGRIGPHKVVIATLPYGECGTVSAARADAKMLLSFPNIRIGLMVVLGAVRLARRTIFVLGTSSSARLATERPACSSMTSARPYKARSSSTHGSSTNHRHFSKPPCHVDATLDMNPRLRPEFQRPDQCTDRLFKAEVTHDPTRATDETHLVPRRERTKDEDNPAIHYGTITSADQLMKDATIRDKLATERNVLCFEMVKKLQRTSEAKQNEDILDWLASNNHSFHQSRFRGMRYRDTSDWFLKSTEFQS